LLSSGAWFIILFTISRISEYFFGIGVPWFPQTINYSQIILWFIIPPCLSAAHVVIMWSLLDIKYAEEWLDLIKSIYMEEQKSSAHLNAIWKVSFKVNEEDLIRVFRIKAKRIKLYLVKWPERLIKQMTQDLSELKT
jgi:hypothetical protein